MGVLAVGWSSGRWCGGGGVWWGGPTWLVGGWCMVVVMRAPRSSLCNTSFWALCRGSADAVSGVTSTTTTHHRTAPSKASPEQLSELSYPAQLQICKHLTTPKIDPKQASMSTFPTSADQTDDGVELPAPCLTTSRRSLMKVGEVVHHHPRRTPMVNRWWLCAVV